MTARDNGLDGGYQWTAKDDGFKDEAFIYLFIFIKSKLWWWR